LNQALLNIAFFILFFHFLKGEDKIPLNCETTQNSSRIVVAGGSITEIIYFLNSEEKIVALDVTSNYPEKAKELPSIGYVRNLSAEGILSMNPSIVFGEDDMGPPGVIKQLRDINIDLRIIPEEKTIDGILDKIYCIASIIDKVPNAESKINSTLIPDILSIEKRLSTSTLIPKRVMFIFSIKGNKIIVAGSGTSGDGFIKMTGSENIFSTIEGWKSVSQEAIIKENPDYVIMSKRDLHNSKTIKSISENPIFKNIRAFEEQNIIFDDAMAMLGFGPRTIKSVLNAVNIMYLKNE
tara:strand:+ start:2091 stop:2975 length:885 start_codon:yes stop_codon:yes gene_type:complete